MVIKKEICDKFDDQELVKQSLENVDYFGCIYERYESRLLAYIKRISYAGDAEAEDILQESFIKIWKNLNEFDHKLKLSSWLYRIVHNTTVSYFRGKSSFGKDNVIQLDDHIMLELRDELELDLDVETIHHFTNKVLNKMPEKYRQYLILRFFEKLSYDEISDVLKVPEGTVATRINRAKKIFKKTAEKENISFNR